ncbi:MAG: ATP-binding protein [Ferruginibacter sp.]
MKEADLLAYLKQNYAKENERCEWKEFSSLKHAVSSHQGDDIISYVSAISNRDGGCLIIGVKDLLTNITGIIDKNNYTPENLPLTLIKQCSNLSDVLLSVEELICSDSNKVVWIVHIPKHSPRRPVLAHKIGWQRIGDSLTKLTAEREVQILSEPLHKVDDWSATISHEATIDDLDEDAIKIAKENYKSKFPEKKIEIESWSNITFLNKSKITIKGKITRSAILLLGKSESEYLLGRSDAKIRWVLKDRTGTEIDYQIFTIPFLTAVNNLYKKIRILKYRYIKADNLFPEEVSKYEPYSIREALNNCIAHQDYEMAARINVVEFDDMLIFSNVGSFIPGSIDAVINNDSPEEQYRNPFLANAMLNLKMVDTIGSGIRKIFNIQRQKFFPMPDYNFSNNKVELTIIGKVLDIDYAKVLSLNPDLNLYEIILLDKVQKKKSNEFSKLEIAGLRHKGLIEGKYPNLIISERVAVKTKQVGMYLKNRGFNKEWYQKLIIEFIKKSSEGASKKDIRYLLWEKLPDILSITQKENKLSDLLSDLRKRGKIENIGSDSKPCWQIK